MLEIFGFEFFRNALIAGILISISCGIIGSFVVVRRIVFMSGGVAHSAFGGIGLSYLMGFSAMAGSLLFAIASALGIGFLGKRGHQSEDTAIGAIWTLGMAAGIIFISLSPGYAPDLMSYLFGSILFVPVSYLYTLLLFDIVIAVVVTVFFNDFIAITFDEEYASIVKVPAEVLYYLLLVLTALAVVMLIKVVGVILCIALLAIPAAISLNFRDTMKGIIFSSIILGIVFTWTGMWLSYITNTPSGAMIVIVAVFAYSIEVAVSNIKRRVIPG